MLKSSLVKFEIEIIWKLSYVQTKGLSTTLIQSKFE